MDERGNDMILHHANVIIVEDSISWPLSGLFDQTGSHEICPKMQEIPKTFQWQ